jgi:hypothetical protein
MILFSLVSFPLIGVILILLQTPFINYNKQNIITSNNEEKKGIIEEIKLENKEIVEEDENSNEKVFRLKIISIVISVINLIISLAL